MKNACWQTVLLGMALAATQAVPAQGQSESAVEDSLPPRGLIAGAPFVSWSEAAQVDYPDKNILNPAATAVLMMQQKFWGLSPTRFGRSGPRIFVRADWQSGERDAGHVLEDLKRPIAQGVPVYVELTLTPYAHPEPVGARIYAVLCDGTKSCPPDGAVSITKDESRAMIAADHVGEGIASGALGRMKPLEALLSLGATRAPFKDRLGNERSDEYIFLRESLYTAPRLLIGYDDERQVMIVHDPSFGPALEIAYDDFDTMWRYSERRYGAAVPAGRAASAPRQSGTSAYAQRTPDMQAAPQFVNGYALEEIGRTAVAQQAFDKGLALPDVGRGYRFMLAFEAAYVALAEHRIEDTVKALQSATEALPQACAGWTQLAKLYRENPSLPDATGQATTLQAKSVKICGDREVQAIFVRTIPRDFYVEGLAQFRGWGYDSSRR